MPKLSLFLLTCTILLSSCSSVTVPPSATATLSPAPPTSSPTETLIPPTPTPPEATPTAVPEIDLKNGFTQEVHVQYLGAQIDASLITDGSLDPTIRKVTVGERAYAEFMARSIYGVWEKSHPGQTLETYLQMLAEVQQGERDPLEVAIPVYANDLRDGIPYQNPDKSVNPAAQKKYLIIPWYKGEAPQSPDGTEVRSVSEINIALVNGKKVKNISLFTKSGYIWGMGTNLDGGALTFSITIAFIDNIPNRVQNTAATLADFKMWMISNTGKSITSWPTTNVKLMKLLMNGGLAVK